MAEENMFNEITEPEAIQPNPDDVLKFEVDLQYKEFIDEYVGEGKKYPNIGEVIKAYHHADRHIPEITRDLAAVKTERDSLKDMLMTNLLKELEDVNTPNPAPKVEDVQPKPAEQAPPSGSEGVEVDLKEKIREALTEAKSEDQARINAQRTEEVMLERFETKEAAQDAVRKRAAELEVSPQWIANMAFENPKAFFVTMGINPDEKPRSNNSPAPRSDVNPQRLADANPSLKPGTYAHYQALRRENPSKFRSVEVQARLMKDAQENPNFYT